MLSHNLSCAARRVLSIFFLSVYLPLSVFAQDDSDDGSTEAGNEGPDSGSFSLSKGGLAAIIIVVCVVAVIGIASTVLFFLAKKRQWEVRKSLKRASRRVTHRLDTARRNRRSRRSGVRMVSPSRAGTSRGANRDDRVRDVEKGQTQASAGKNKTPTMSAFEVDTPIVRSWKDKVFGYKAPK
ncbi:hypothetical protein K490DRAFT_60933 [Saccharata proteae CBS 121410]|uniref:Transmembrane protein n=1 Tax=Saccharata proteae CBS 121410 TaxID=1314787 RepID=A0A9P4M346_9PEZI|nr:hypothetical protein K490DRAFT_60933 [Saccharata proteae CBS 121410]